MKVHWLQHAEHEELGCIAPWLAARGDVVSCSRLYASEPPPAPGAHDLLIVMGGPMNIYEYDAHPWLRAEQDYLRAALARGTRMLGICLGAQLIADAAGGRVTRNAHTEIGWHEVRLAAGARGAAPFADFPERFSAFHWHGDTFSIPPGARALMASAACANQAYVLGDRVAAIQFHLEVTAADARTWLALETPPASEYVQSAAEMLRDVGRFAANNRLMLRLLERLAA